MIDVTVYKTNDIFDGFIVEGHSGYRESGNDIICASVSILSYTTLNSMDLVAGISPEYWPRSLAISKPRICRKNGGRGFSDFFGVTSGIGREAELPGF